MSKASYYFQKHRPDEQGIETLQCQNLDEFRVFRSRNTALMNKGLRRETIRRFSPPLRFPTRNTALMNKGLRLHECVEAHRRVHQQPTQHLE